MKEVWKRSSGMACCFMLAIWGVSKIGVEILN